MADNPLVPGGDGTNPGGNGEDPKVVPYSKYEETVTQSKNRGKRVQELESENARLKEAADAAAKKQAETDGNYKLIAEQERERAVKLADDLKAKDAEISSYKTRITTAQKWQALQKTVGQLDGKYSALVDFDKIVVDPDSGEINQLSLEKYASSFKTEFPEITAKVGALPPQKLPAGDQGGGSGTKIKHAEWLKLSGAEQRKYTVGDIID